MNTVVDTSLCDAAQIRAAFDQARKQGLRAKDAAQSLGLSEGAVLAAHCGEHAGSLQVQPLKPQWLEILQALQPCGPLMALTRNEAVVHEKDGIYQGFTKEGPIGLCNNEDIDLRLFFFAWHAGFAVTESGRYGQPMHSLQFYDQHGTAVHKIYVRPQTEMQAWEQVVQAFADSAQRYSFVEKAERAPVADDASIDAAGLRQAWAQLKDTHDFFGMLKTFGCERQQSFRLTRGAFCEPLSNTAVTQLLEQAASAELPIMVFVGSKGCIQIHSGPVRHIKPLQTPGSDWINVLDPGFNLHLRRDLITSTWLVRKPTTDGVVTSVELFDATGDVVVMFFGVRKPGQAELQAWRTLAEGLPRA